VLHSKTIFQYYIIFDFISFTSAPSAAYPPTVRASLEFTPMSMFSDSHY
jgi:hypothetical protein